MTPGLRKFNTPPDSSSQTAFNLFAKEDTEKMGNQINIDFKQDPEILAKKQEQEKQAILIKEIALKNDIPEGFLSIGPDGVPKVLRGEGPELTIPEYNEIRGDRSRFEAKKASLEQGIQ